MVSAAPSDLHATGSKGAGSPATVRHVLITGTGRAGTTALVTLLDECGLETGQERLKYHDYARAGLESTLGPDSPRVVKSPYLAEELPGLLRNGLDPACIEWIVLPMRDIDAVVASRLANFRKRGLRAAGGLWRPEAIPPSGNRDAMTLAVHGLLVVAAEHAIPVILLHFPRFIRDSEYAYRQLCPLFGGTLTTEQFAEVHRRVLKEEMISGASAVAWSGMFAADVRWLRLRAVRRSRLLLRRSRQFLSPSTRADGRVESARRGVDAVRHQ
jgi:hypothetical protein